MNQGRRREKSIPNKLWIARKCAGYPLKWVASLLGHRSISLVSEYEHGRSLPNLRTALKLACIYGTPIAELFPDFQADVVREIEAAKERHAALRRHDDERTKRVREFLSGVHESADRSAPVAIQSTVCSFPQSRVSSRSPLARST